ncbi:UDP-N-acetylmuramoylalanyl-D-glutamate--2,6-diaminopimelate ligase [Roseivirga seohaensis subsp. aquiponti]|uniref:UDP-N-acetylmuramoyl-L-alanyl-D-glutamate--2,6-diaminopimelate ligase n=1 Tax=Roseivirga seohaensis subsp. aquiponti TaxID=1566026 RepID=A0A0L8AH89_9BACT|nr:UDP-N-acetylmuramoyl-L-alanyl-D-glutamate--2,6-diaminopimelate ligase [Roseivirga seohaensis]KOF01510.1 UDP-N-acetylmuramoylalanyl-D-glutamate--2,6-diaminopimelate ligase [Roseivirga seohaensis subsp. aquiponti]
MSALKDILYKVALQSVSGDTAVEVAALAFDSRRVEANTAFIATRGTQVDGHDYIEQAIEKGAVAIICEVLPESLNTAITYVQVKNSSEALGIMASNFFGNPSAKLKLVGVTGTNGKTTCVSLLFQLFKQLGYNVGLLSTVVNKINDEIIVATHTTPDAIQMNELMAKMVAKGCSHCFMEVSSHALVQHRVSGLTFTGAVFTNLSHDHLDYHKTFDEYIKAKKMLFDGLPSSAFALTNTDDKRGSIMLQNTKATKHSYALKTMADFKARILSNTLQGLELDIEGHNVWFKLIGDFNAYNLMAVYGAAILLEEEPADVLQTLSNLNPAPGRFEQVLTDTGITAIVDYAHTPDALENVLSTIKVFRSGNEKVITVVGCGGNRDTTKRPEMAKIACELSDKVVLTSDNPRFEEPMAIIEDMQKGVSPSNYRKTLVMADRREAIKTACSMAEPKDIILVAGKGHETYQDVKGVKSDFDDRKVLKEMLNLIHK